MSAWDHIDLSTQANGTLPVKGMARTISLLENEVSGYQIFLESLRIPSKKVIGITGPPGAGKSTLVDNLLNEFVSHNYKVAVLCIDPSSPFNMGAVLGDRIRMSSWYNNPNVYIRSLASRGSLGGLSSKIIEITEFVKTTPVDYVLIETVGVGQSEIEIAGLADITLVVVVPEGGDEIQTMKAGIMEVANIFVVNKADRAGADAYVKNLKTMLAPAFSKTHKEIPIVKVSASQRIGIDELWKQLAKQLEQSESSDKKIALLTDKVWQIIASQKMKHIKPPDIQQQLSKASAQPDFNIFRFAKKYF